MPVRPLLALLLAAWLLTPASNPLHADELRIVSWNLDLHGNPNLKPFRTQAPDDLARILHHLKPNVLVVQEARADLGHTTHHPRNRTLRAALSKLPNNWKHVLLPASSPSRDMRTGVAWNSDMIDLNNGPQGTRVHVRRAKVPGTKLRTFLRHPYAFHFAVRGNQTDFLLLPLHFKAENRSNPHTLFRLQEAQELAEALPRTLKHFREQDLILIGRLQSAHSEPATQALESLGLTDANPNDLPTLLTVEKTDQQAKQVVPRFAPTRAFLATQQPELANPRFTVTPLDTMATLGFSPKYYYQHISDYLPATITLNLQPDDD